MTEDEKTQEQLETLAAVSEPRVIIEAELHGLAGREAELRQALDELAIATRAEDGCRRFRVLSAEEPGEIVLLTAWSDRKALDEHYRSRHHRRYRDAVGPLLARPSDVLVHHLTKTIRALDPNLPEPGLFG
jgi:quinol monooxygenase YgiN